MSKLLNCWSGRKDILHRQRPVDSKPKHLTENDGKSQCPYHPPPEEVISLASSSNKIQSSGCETFLNQKQQIASGVAFNVVSTASISSHEIFTKPATNARKRPTLVIRIKRGKNSRINNSAMFSTIPTTKRMPTPCSSGNVPVKAEEATGLEVSITCGPDSSSESSIVSTLCDDKDTLFPTISLQSCRYRDDHRISSSVKAANTKSTRSSTCNSSSSRSDEHSDELRQQRWMRLVDEYRHYHKEHQSHHDGSVKTTHTLSTISSKSFTSSSDSDEMQQNRWRRIFDEFEQQNIAWDLVDDVDDVADLFSSIDYVEQENVSIIRAILLQRLSPSRFLQLTVNEKVHISNAIRALDQSGAICCEQGMYKHAIRRFERALYLKRLTFHSSQAAATLRKSDEMESTVIECDFQNSDLELISREDSLDAKSNFYSSSNNISSWEDGPDQNTESMLASIATSINNITYLKQLSGAGNANEIMSLYRYALRMKREILGPRHVSVAKTLNNIGSVFYLQRDYQSALAAYEDAYRILISAPGEKSISHVATVLSNIGDVYRCLCNRVKALETYRGALSIRWKLLGPQDDRVIRLMEQTAMLELKLVHGGLTQPLGPDSASDSEDEEYLEEDRVRHIQYLEAVNDLKEKVQADLDFFEWMENKASVEFLLETSLVDQEIKNLYVDSVECSEKPSSNYDDARGTDSSENEKKIDRKAKHSPLASPMSAMEYPFFQSDRAQLQKEDFSVESQICIGKHEDGTCNLVASKEQPISASAVHVNIVHLSSSGSMDVSETQQLFTDSRNFSFSSMALKEKNETLASVRLRLASIRKARNEKQQEQCHPSNLISDTSLERSRTMTLSDYSSCIDPITSSSIKSSLCVSNGERLPKTLLNAGIITLRNGSKGIVSNKVTNPPVSNGSSSAALKCSASEASSSSSRRASILAMYKERKQNGMYSNP